MNAYVLSEKNEKSRESRSMNLHVIGLSAVSKILLSALKDILVITITEISEVKLGKDNKRQKNLV